MNTNRIPKIAALAPKIVLYVAVITYIIFFALLALAEQRTTQSDLDAAFYDQALWNTARGRPFAMSLQPGRTNKLADHIQPTIALFAPLYWLPHSLEIFLVAVVIIIALGAFPVYSIALNQLRNRYIALIFALAYLLHPTVQAASLTNFHSVNLVIPLFLCALQALQSPENRRRRIAFFILLILAMGCREEVALSVIMVGIYIAAIMHQPRLGVTTTALGIGWFAAINLIIIPALHPNDIPHIELFSSLGQTPSEIIVAMLTNPLAVLRLIFTAAKLTYIRDLLIPVAFLPLLNLPAALTGAAALLINLLSTQELLYTIEWHYNTPLIPFLFFSSIYGARVLLRLGRGRLTALVTTASLLGCSLWYSYYYGFSPLYGGFQYPETTAHHRLLPQLISAIPPTAGVTAQPDLTPHLSQREHAYPFPYITPQTDYILLDLAYALTDLTKNESFYRDVWETLHNPEFEIATAQNGYILLQRSATAAPRAAAVDYEKQVFHENLGLAASFYDFARAAEIKPRFPVTVDFGRELRLLGIDFIPLRDCQIRVKTYWRALDAGIADYDIDIWLHDAAGAVHWRNGTPLVEMWYPTSWWQPDEIIIVESRPIALEHLGAGFFSIQVPLAADDAQVLRPRLREAELFMPMRDYNLVLPGFRCDRAIPQITPTARQYAAPDIANELAINFGDQLMLRGYEWQSATVSAGAELQFTLYWQALTAPLAYYNVFVHVLDPAGAKIAQYDAPPLAGAYPTSWWARGEFVADARRVPLPADMPPGEYEIWIGIYDLETMTRLSVSGEHARIESDAVLLQKIEIH